MDDEDFLVDNEEEMDVKEEPIKGPSKEYLGKLQYKVIFITINYFQLPTVSSKGTGTRHPGIGYLSELGSHCSLFRSKRFMLDEMTQRNMANEAFRWNFS